MTGPEHYAEAERLLNLANVNANVEDPGYRFAEVVAEAQVHATLALAAATLNAAEHTSESAYNVARGARPGRLVSRPHPGDEVDPPYPGNDWGRAIHGEATR